MVFKAHDVRRLRLCAGCRKPGLLDTMLVLGRDREVALFHGSCAAASMGEDGLLALPASERRKLTVADTGVALMRRLLASDDASEGLGSQSAN